jgi:hypothetical protein
VSAKLSQDSSITAEGAPLKVLLIEDNAADAMVAQAAIEKAAIGRTKVLRAERIAKAFTIARGVEVHSWRTGAAR